MSTPKQIARGLLSENRNREHPVSWRALERRTGVNHGTLCRFAKSKGHWIPKSEEIQSRLGILKVKKVQPKMISEQTENELIDALRNRQPMKDVDPRIVLAFKKLGWLKPMKMKAGRR